MRMKTRLVGMSTKSSVLGRAVKAVKRGMAPQRYGVHGKAFACVLCGHDRFTLGTGGQLLGLSTLVCAECHHVEFFEGNAPAL